MTGEVPRSTGANRADKGTTEHATGADAEDRTLLERLRAGEDAAFGELFSRHSTAVFRLALGLVNDRAEAEDLTAEAFFRVLQAIRRGSGPVDNVRGYLLIVARRVAWEWSLRRKDVPVSDEELTHRAASDPDTSGQFTERSLIRRAFTSLPERWRNVLWKMEVEGERPAAVATNFGLSPNATAALARRARQGLRAAYLQAHLAADRSATGCRSVLEKLGAYTAGSTSGIERRRIRAHLQTCASCTAMYAELRDVCSGLRAHAAYVAAPVAVVAGAGLAAQAGGLGASVKSLLVSTKIQIGIAAGSAAAIGVLGFVAAPWGSDGDGSAAPVDLAGKRGVELHVDEPPAGRSSESSLQVTEGELTTHRRVPREGPAPEADRPARDVTPTEEAPAPATTTTEDGSRLDSPMMSEEAPFDETAPIVYRETRVERQTTTYEDHVVVYETTTITEVNSLDQTRTTTENTSYAQAPGSTPPPSGGQQTARTAEPTAPSSAPDGP
ncbi:MAG: sigma-70 family RNA polymerase sigma factor [Actinophytocola sp.]|uniref:sigma-70 family RNA polymerase sigma factor n=1 Tax=Actinophytocola sp. TaxID=1872138 RepID=UPI00132B0D40|nr:sigma-70 family RNA polymerase sigma factor [Actinophytocola sp.]MPZ81352.1 sigma-70 family RNA polymerase sigma factor [Actinophytocola sp.]